jgi:hypothetical protein
MEIEGTDFAIFIAFVLKQFVCALLLLMLNFFQSRLLSKWRLFVKTGIVGARVLRSLLAFLVCCLSWSTIAFAHVTASIHGIVTDPSGGLVVGARITLVNETTGLRREAITDSNGRYEFLEVPIGSSYSINATASGFQKVHQSGITLTVNQQFLDDLHLAIGNVTQEIQVSSDVTQVETSSTQLGNVIVGSSIVAMPLNGRSYTDLLSLQAGVIPVASSSAIATESPSGDLDPGILSVNGARENGNAFLVNGGDVNESRDNGTSIIPTLDAIAEFKILTNNYDAEYRKFAGGIINVVTKSGTNHVNGNVFEFLRNDDLDARNYFDPTRGSFKQNQFGGTVEGPILRNRLFFFNDYQGTRLVFGESSGTVVVPSTSERTGNFSDVSSLGLPSLTGDVEGLNAPDDFASTLSSRLGYAVSAGEPYWFSGCNSTTQCVFPGEVIPKSAWSPAATGTLQFIPQANSPSGFNWSSGSQNETLRDDKWGERIDLNRTQSDRLPFYYNFDDAKILNPFAGANTPVNVPGFPALTKNRSQQANNRDTYAFESQNTSGSTTRCAPTPA